MGGTLRGKVDGFGVLRVGREVLGAGEECVVLLAVEPSVLVGVGF